MHLFGCKFSMKMENGDTIQDRKNFDSLLWAIVTVFQVRTEIMHVHVNIAKEFLPKKFSPTHYNYRVQSEKYIIAVLLKPRIVQELEKNTVLLK